jgi:uncharacterized protein (TIGR02271 family)
MSGSYMNESNSSSLNQGAAHEAGLYDPSMHDNQIVALYDSRAHADAAREKLLAAGVDSASVQVMDKGADEMAGGVDYEAGNQGLWGSIKSLFMPDEDAHAYSHAVGAGHAMVVVTPNAKSDRNHIIQTLEGTNPLDFDAKLEEWRQSGDNYTPASTTTSGMADTTGAAAAPGAMPMASTSATGGAATAGVAAAGAVTSGAATMGTATPRAPMTGAPKAAAPMAGGTARAGDSETIKVMEERLRVGKREVAGGAVRVRSYVVERPVEEQVRLHEERVSVERHPVDRAVTGAEASAFQERTIEARATSEEAVIGKEARVVEEIGIRKEASDRTETVRDTVRSTKVDVEDGTKAVPGAATTKPTGPAATTTGTSSSGSMGTGGATPNSTPGATTSGMNTPRK